MDFVDRHSPRDFMAAAAVADGLTEALDGLWQANDLATLALSDHAFSALRDAAKVAGTPPQAIARQFGMAQVIRDRLKVLGWTAPGH